MSHRRDRPTTRLYRRRPRQLESDAAGIAEIKRQIRRERQKSWLTAIFIVVVVFLHNLTGLIDLVQRLRAAQLSAPMSTARATSLGIAALDPPPLPLGLHPYLSVMAFTLPNHILEYLIHLPIQHPSVGPRKAEDAFVQLARQRGHFKLWQAWWDWTIGVKYGMQRTDRDVLEEWQELESWIACEEGGRRDLTTWLHCLWIHRHSSPPRLYAISNFCGNITQHTPSLLSSLDALAGSARDTQHRALTEVTNLTDKYYPDNNNDDITPTFLNHLAAWRHVYASGLATEMLAESMHSIIDSLLANCATQLQHLQTSIRVTLPADPSGFTRLAYLDRLHTYLSALSPPFTAPQDYKAHDYSSSPYVRAPFTGGSESNKGARTPLDTFFNYAVRNRSCEFVFDHRLPSSLDAKNSTAWNLWLRGQEGWGEELWETVLGGGQGETSRGPEWSAAALEFGVAPEIEKWRGCRVRLEEVRSLRG